MHNYCKKKCNSSMQGQVAIKDILPKYSSYRKIILTEIINHIIISDFTRSDVTAVRKRI